MYNVGMDNDNLVIGVLVWNEEDRLFLLEKSAYPWGYTPPAIIIDKDDDPEKSAYNLLQELNLKVHSLEIAADDRETNQEHELDSTYYQWVVYEAKFAGNLEELAETEGPSTGWFTHEALQQLADRTKRYYEDQLSDDAWEARPGLDTAWHDRLVGLGVIESPLLVLDEFDETDELETTRSDQEPPQHPPET